MDALGGVDVDSEYDFESYGFQFHKGINHLDGEQALAFSRERYAFSSGDNQRGQNQMLVLTAILDKLQSPALLKNPSGVLEVMGSSMQTSFTTDQITELISWQLDNGQGWEIERQAVTGTGDSQQTFSMKGTDLYVMWPDEEAVSEAAAAVSEAASAAGESASEVASAAEAAVSEAASAAEEAVSAAASAVEEAVSEAAS